jgi:hypothetical protein
MQFELNMQQPKKISTLGLGDRIMVFNRITKRRTNIFILFLMLYDGICVYRQIGHFLFDACRDFKEGIESTYSDVFLITMNITIFTHVYSKPKLS